VLEEVVTITRDYFTNNIDGCSFAADVYHANNPSPVMRISRNSQSFMTVGENYQFEFEHMSTSEIQTRIVVTISLKFGTTPQYREPSKILFRWAELVGAEPINFGRKMSIGFWTVLIIFCVLITLPLIIFLVIMFS